MLFDLAHNMFFFRRGALTSKPYSFLARPWEFKSVESIDFFDSTGGSARFDMRGDKVVRAIPRVNEDVNEEWASDRLRFSVDGFRVQRLDKPFIRNFDQITGLSWSKFMFIFCKSVLFFYYNNFYLNRLQILSNSYSKSGLFPLQVGNVSSFFDFESAAWLNFFSTTFFLRKVFFGFNFRFFSFRSSFLLPFSFKDLFKFKNLLLISINPRFEAPILNIRLRQSVIKFGNNISSFGHNFFSNFNLLVNAGILSLIKFISGNHWLCSSFTKGNSFLLVGNAFSKLVSFEHIFKFCKQIFRVGVFNRYSSTINAAEAGLVVSDISNTNVSRLFKLFFYTGDMNFLKVILNKRDFENLVEKNLCLASATHGFNQLSKFDFILPSSAPFERNSIFINLEGRPQLSRILVNSPNNVLDLKDSVIMILTLFLNVFYSKKLLFRFSSLISKNAMLFFDKKSLWVLVRKLIKLFNNSRSFFIKTFYSSLLEYLSLLSNDRKILNTEEAGLVNVFDNFLKNQLFLLENRNSSLRFEAPDDFYTQDDISCSSPTMLIGSERFGSIHRTYQ